MVRGVAGVTLLELLLALALAGLVVQIALATLQSSRTMDQALMSSVALLQREHGAPALLRQLTAEVGRAALGCVLDARVGGAVLAWSELRSDGVLERLELFAARDAQRQSALYLRRGSAARQPLLEGVERMEVVAAEAPAGGSPPRWRAVTLELGWEDGALQRLDLPLRHAPCLEAP